MPVRVGGPQASCGHYERVAFGARNEIGPEEGGVQPGKAVVVSIDGRDPEYHGYPIPIANLVASLQGSAYVARGSVHNAAAIAQTRKFVRKAFQRQLDKKGLSLVEILTMCPTGWFVPAAGGADYMMESLGKTYPLGELKDVVEG